jgi:alkanesulfonate monooxygenase SsuD/methylene tetrahydromethanopterin reductase-like flavin-dependent oxidoreductase (luciferase family)
LAGITKHVVVRETDAEALALARRAWPAFQRNWGATSLRQPGGQVASARSDEFDAVLAENTRLLVGSPRTIRDYLDACLERLADKPSFYFAPAIQWGDLTYAESLESLQLFADQVMPAFTNLLHTS